MKTINRRYLYLALIILVLIGVIGLITLKGPLAPFSVQTVQIKQSDLTPALFGVGTIKARRSYIIGPIRSGRLQQLLVDEGDRVTAGQLLGQMDPVDLTYRLQSAQLSIEKYEHMVEAAQARLDEARSRYAQAKHDDLRYRELVEKKQISYEAAEAKATAAMTAKDQVNVAAADLEATRHDFQRAQSDLKAVQAQIDDLKLMSPVTGIVSSRDAEPGSLVVGGTPVLHIIDDKTLWVRVRVEQRDSAELKTGLPADIFLRSHSEEPLAGKVARLELIADELTEERWVDVAFAQIPEGIAIGTLANVTIHLPMVQQAKWLPAAALQHHKRQTGIWLVRDGRAHFAIVKTGTRTLDGKVQILSGITADDVVVSYSKKPLSEGQRLKVINHD